MSPDPRGFTEWKHEPDEFDRAAAEDVISALEKRIRDLEGDCDSYRKTLAIISQQASADAKKLVSKNGQQVSTLSDLREEMRAKARGTAAQPCDRCKGTGTVHGMAENEGGAFMASWPCERCGSSSEQVSA